MLPTGIEYNYHSTPWATLGLILACSLIFLLQLSAPIEDQLGFMIQPDRVAPWQWVTSTFMHGGLLHLAGNMLFLWVYGRYLEERLGHGRYLGLYLALGLGASLVFFFAHFGEGTPALGASGAISGLMGVVLIAAPRAKVHVVWRLYWSFHVPAWLLLGHWVMEQFWMASAGVEGIAIAAHLGGFALGAIAAALMRGPLVQITGWFLDPAASTHSDITRGHDEAIWEAIADHHARKRGPRLPPGGLPAAPGEPKVPTWDGASGPRRDDPRNR